MTLLADVVATSRRVADTPSRNAKIAELAQSMPQIVECDRITGDDCFIAKVFVARIEDLERVIDRLIPYAQTNTSIIQSSPVRLRAPKYS